MSHWNSIAIGDLVESIKTWNPLRERGDATFRYIDLGAIDQDTKTIIGAREVICREAPSRARQLVSAGDILVSTVRPNLNGVAKVSAELEGATASTGFCVLRPRPESLSSNYLFHWVKSPEFVADLVSKATGASYPAVSDRIICESTIPVPSQPEQCRIAAILDQADSLRTKRQEALAQLERLTHSIFVEMFGDPAKNTLTLPLASLKDLGIWRSGGTPPRTAAQYFVGDIPWFSSGELESMYVADSYEHISETAIRETSAKLVPAGSLMLGMYDTAALKASISSQNCSCNQAIAFSKIEHECAETVYVYYAIVIGREHFRRLQRGVRQKNLNLSMVKDIQIPLPPLQLQRIFADRVSAIEALKTIHRQALAELNKLCLSLQRRAFRGEL